MKQVNIWKYTEITNHMIKNSFEQAQNLCIAEKFKQTVAKIDKTLLKECVTIRHPFATIDNHIQPYATTCIH